MINVSNTIDREREPTTLEGSSDLFSDRSTLPSTRPAAGTADATTVNARRTRGEATFDAREELTSRAVRRRVLAVRPNGLPYN